MHGTGWRMKGNDIIIIISKSKIMYEIKIKY